MDSRGNYSNYNAGGIRDRGDRRGERNRGPRNNQNGQYRRDDPRSENYRNDNYRGDSYRSNRRDMDAPNQQVHIRDNSYNKQYNNTSSSSLVNSNSNVNLLQSPFQNPYKIDSNNSVRIVNDPSRDRLETYAKLKKISPVKFYISIIISVIMTAALVIYGAIAILNKGLAAANIKDVTTGVAQGYFFYGAFMLIAVFTGVYAFIRKWNNLLVTYCSFLFVSCLYLGYFITELANIKTNSITVMDKRWKEELTNSEKESIQTKFECCGYYTSDDDPYGTDECSSEANYTKRSLVGIINEPVYFNSSHLSKRTDPEEGGCAIEIVKVINTKMTMYIIILVVLLILNIAAVVLTIMDIKQHAEILEELSNPFA